MSRGEVAATLNRLAPTPRSGGLGAGTRVHAAPFQCSIRGRNRKPPMFSLPTAHALAELSAVTPHRSLSRRPARGDGTTRHALPSQRSVRVRNAPAPPSYPTAQALAAEPADTPTSVLSTRDPLGLATMLHPSRGPAAAAAGDRPLSGAAAPPSTQPARPSVTPARRTDSAGA